jgi:hypothetical protein
MNLKECHFMDRVVGQSGTGLSNRFPDDRAGSGSTFGDLAALDRSAGRRCGVGRADRDASAV